MQLLALLLTLSTLLLLTTQNPISKSPPARVPSKNKPKFEFPSLRVPRKENILVVNNKSGGCDLKIVNVFKCDAQVTVDKSRKCDALSKEKKYKGKVCGKGEWTLFTREGLVATFQDEVGDKVWWTID
ncbi:MAG: hypothetical protein Q9178_002462 [Gyalolechia marmorata]